MTQRLMWPNPNRLSVTVNGRTYSTTDSATPIEVNVVDIPIMAANGWFDMGPAADSWVATLVSLTVAQLLETTQISALQLQTTVKPLSQANGASGNVAWNVAQGYKATITLSANANVVLPTNIPAAGRGVLVVTQNAASNWPATFNAAFHTGGANMTLTATNGAVDAFQFEFDSSRIIVTGAQKNIG